MLVIYQLTLKIKIDLKGNKDLIKKIIEDMSHDFSYEDDELIVEHPWNNKINVEKIDQNKTPSEVTATIQLELNYVDKPIPEGKVKKEIEGINKFFKNNRKVGYYSFDNGDCDLYYPYEIVGYKIIDYGNLPEEATLSLIESEGNSFNQVNSVLCVLLGDDDGEIEQILLQKGELNPDVSLLNKRGKIDDLQISQDDGELKVDISGKSYICQVNKVYGIYINDKDVYRRSAKRKVFNFYPNHAKLLTEKGEPLLDFVKTASITASCTDYEGEYKRIKSEYDSKARERKKIEGTLKTRTKQWEGKMKRLEGFLSNGIQKQEWLNLANEVDKLDGEIGQYRKDIDEMKKVEGKLLDTIKDLKKKVKACKTYEKKKEKTAKKLQSSWLVDPEEIKDGIDISLIKLNQIIEPPVPAKPGRPDFAPPFDAPPSETPPRFTRPPQPEPPRPGEERLALITDNDGDEILEKGVVLADWLCDIGNKSNFGTEIIAVYDDKFYSIIINNDNDEFHALNEINFRDLEGEAKKDIGAGGDGGLLYNVVKAYLSDLYREETGGRAFGRGGETKGFGEWKKRFLTISKTKKRAKPTGKEFMRIRILDPAPQDWYSIKRKGDSYYIVKDGVKYSSKFVTLDIGEKDIPGIQGIGFLRGVLKENNLKVGTKVETEHWKSQAIRIEYLKIKSSCKEPSKEQVEKALNRYEKTIIEFLDNEYPGLSEIKILPKGKDFKIELYGRKLKSKKLIKLNQIKTIINPGTQLYSILSGGGKKNISSITDTLKETFQKALKKGLEKLEGKKEEGEKEEKKSGFGFGKIKELLEGIRGAFKSGLITKKQLNSELMKLSFKIAGSDEGELAEEKKVELLELINDIRESAGFSPLDIDNFLTLEN